MAFTSSQTANLKKEGAFMSEKTVELGNNMVSLYGVYDYGGYDKNYEVVICGGGTSGVAAAIAAARTGAKVLLIERTGQLGGQMSLSGPPGFAYAHMFNAKGQQDTAGIVEETHQRLYNQGHAIPHLRPKHRRLAGYTFSYVDPEWWTLEIFDMMEATGVILLLDTLVVGVTKDGDKVTGVIVENANGRNTIPAKMVIDCTGEAYVSKMAGCETVETDRNIIQPHSICFTADGVNWEKLIKYVNNHPEEFTWDQLACVNPDVVTRELVMDVYRKVIDIKELGELMGFFDLRKVALENGDWHPNSGAGFFIQPKEGGRILAHFQHSCQVDHALPSDAWDLTRCNIECRKQIRIAWRFFKNYVPGFENAYITRIGSELRLREGARIVGDYALCKEDVRNEARFKDVIGMSNFPAGAHHTTNDKTLAVISDHKDGNNEFEAQNESEFAAPKDQGSYAIPYRVLVPKKVENILVAGKCVSTDRSAYLRYLQQTMVTGQAAGVAAALCVRDGKNPRGLETDVSELQSILKSQGAILSLPDDKVQI
jgi:ribulose 1,5-bisphosphate synthetase/thiazole synthase